MRRCGYARGEFPNRGLRSPKVLEKAKFQTWAEIERQISKGRHSEMEQADLWDRLYLTTTEIGQILDFVECQPNNSFMDPMLLIAAHR